MRYNNYHKHTMYSNVRVLDCVVKPEEYIKRAVELGHTTYFTTEHGFCGDLFEAKTLCDKYGLKCIYGVEAYYVDDSSIKEVQTAYHIVLIAMTNKGRREINRIVSRANTEGFYYKPRIDKSDLLSLDPEGVVVTTACVASRMFKGEDWYDEFFLSIHEHFGDHMYLEVQSHNDPKQIEFNKKIVKVAEHTGCKLIHGNDSHYILPSDSKYRELFLKAKGIIHSEEDGFVLDYPDSDTIVKRYKEQGVLSPVQIAEALENTLIFDNAEELDINKEFKIPKVSEDSNKELRQIVAKAWKKERDNVPKERWKEYMQEINSEIEMIEKCGMADYFVLNYKVVDKAVNEYNGVLTRTGRGSAVSFYVNKLLGFTGVDRIASPVKLYPSRFMTDTRILESRSLPDIDLNWANVQPAIDASKDILGEDGIYYMVAWKPLQESSAFRLWCKANDMDINEYDDIAKNLENYIDNPKWAKLIEDSKAWRGVVESIAPSPCSVLLLDKSISEEIGLIKVGDVMCCNITGYQSDVYKYLKNDFLTVSVWEIISKTYEMIGQPIDTINGLLSKIDDKTWKLYEDGITCTLNQADSDFATPLVMKYKPKNLKEMASFVAGIRPSFASLLNGFLNREEYTTGVKALDEVFEETDHRPMFQESLMAFLMWLNVPEKETYDIIKKIAKKKFKENELQELKARLSLEWEKNVGTIDGFSQSWETIEHFASYGFNACVSGDTIIQRSRNQKFTPTIEEMYLIKNDYDYAKRTGHKSLYKKYNYQGYGSALSMDSDGRIRSNRIVDIRYNDIKDIYRVSTTSGAYIDCTMNHKFPTPNGKKKLEDLKIGDLLFVKGEYEKHPDSYRFTDGNFETNYPSKGQWGFRNKPDGNSVKFHNIRNAKANNNCPCEVCGKEYDGSKFELHHIDLDRENNEPQNLLWVCNSCHKKEHYKIGRTKQYEKGIPTRLEEIVSIEFIRTDKTYDVEMEAPSHTFVSESGLVTSNSHAVCMALDSMYCAYLKSHYPLEYYTIVLTMYGGDIERTRKLTNELDYFNIKLSPIKFGKSSAFYTPSPHDNTIYKGIASIKYCNEIIAGELMEVYNRRHDNFLDVLKDIKENTSIDKRQLGILITLDFFSEYGNNQMLLNIVEAYDKFADRKTIKKDKLEELGISEFLAKKHSAKESPKQFSGIDGIGLVRDMALNFPNKRMPLREQVEKELEYLGYIDSIIPELPDYYHMVVAMKTYKDSSKPYVTMRQLSTGEEVKTRIKQGKLYEADPFTLYDILVYDDLTLQEKMRKNDAGKWQGTGEFEPVITAYSVLKEE